MATIILDSKTVIELADNTINDIDSYQRAQNERMIAEAMKPTTLFGFQIKKPKTYNEAIDALLRGHDGRVFWEFPCYSGGHIVEHCKRLIQLAELAEHITVTEKDLHILTGGTKTG